MKSVLHLLLFTMLTTACSTTTQETVTIQELNKQFISAWNTKEADKITGFLAEDVQFVQGSSHWQGKSEVASKWVRTTLPTLEGLKIYALSSGMDSQTAYEAGTFSVEVLPASPDEPKGKGEGNFMLLWKKSPDTGWKLSYVQLEDLPVRTSTAVVPTSLIP
ncbi:YybH family protein [Larkinella bovis]|uniref:YybH family protein n=1 Tax=Larkinella bovis TaxID=683041 RepID=A0ABW0I964_9BACT